MSRHIKPEYTRAAPPNAGCLALAGVPTPCVYCPRQPNEGRGPGLRALAWLPPAPRGLPHRRPSRAGFSGSPLAAPPPHPPRPRSPRASITPARRRVSPRDHTTRGNASGGERLGLGRGRGGTLPSPWQARCAARPCAAASRPLPPARSRPLQARAASKPGHPPLQDARRVKVAPPCCCSRSTTSALPLLTAACIGASPFRRRALGSAPASSSSWMMERWPRCAA